MARPRDACRTDVRWRLVPCLKLHLDAVLTCMRFTINSCIFHASYRIVWMILMNCDVAIWPISWGFFDRRKTVKWFFFNGFHSLVIFTRCILPMSTCESLPTWWDCSVTKILILGEELGGKKYEAVKRTNLYLYHTQQCNVTELDPLIISSNILALDGPWQTRSFTTP